MRLGTVANVVQWSKGSVAIECRSTETLTTANLRASAVIVTVPIGVLKAPREQEGAIRFEPALREKQTILERLETGHVVKIALRFRERFWEERNFVHSSDPFLPTWWTTAPVRSPILVGWAGGHAADALLAEGPSTLVDRALDSLSRVWRVPRRRLDALLAGSFTHDWQRDPFSRGAYSYAAVGGHTAHAALARPVQRTIFFAGEATSSDQTGTVAGAIESGFRAAREAMK